MSNSWALVAVQGRKAADGKGSQASNYIVSYSSLDSHVAAFGKYRVSKEGTCRNKKVWASRMVPWRNVLYPSVSCWRIPTRCSLLNFPKQLVPGTQSQAQKGLSLPKCQSLRTLTEKSWGCAMNRCEKTRKKKAMKLPGGFTVTPEHRRMQTEGFVEVFGKHCCLQKSGRQ